MIFRGVLFFPLLNSKVNAGVFPFCVYQFQFTVTPRMYVGFFLSVSCQILHLEQSQSYSLVSHAPCNPDGRSSKNISVIDIIREKAGFGMLTYSIEVLLFLCLCPLWTFFASLAMHLKRFCSGYLVCCAALKRSPLFIYSLSQSRSIY